MNAPSGLALAGYTNCHMRPVPYGFGCLGDTVAPNVKRLLNALFVNDIPKLQPKNDKNLRPVVIIAMARSIGLYNDLLQDISPEFGIILKI